MVEDRYTDVYIYNPSDNHYYGYLSTDKTSSHLWDGKTFKLSVPILKMKLIGEYNLLSDVLQNHPELVME